MKHIIITLITTISILSCKAQVPLTEMYENTVNGEYYKDLNNNLNNLSGIWSFNNGNETLIINFDVKEHFLMTSSVYNTYYYEDVLYGEYQYINENGLEINNTLHEMDSVIENPYERLIYGNYIKRATDLPTCDDCLTDERRVEVSIKDSERDYFDYDMIIRHYPDDPFGEPEHITITITKTGSAWIPDGEPNTHRLPKSRELTLYKQ